MKKLILLWCALLFSLSGFAQFTTISVPVAGSLKIASTTGKSKTYAVSTLLYEVDSVGNTVKIYLNTDAQLSVASNIPTRYRSTDGTQFATVSDVATYLSSKGVAANPAGGGGGGGGGGTSDTQESTQVLVKNAVQAINTKTPALGQAAMAASVPVTLASNQTAVPVTGSFYQTTQPVSAASLPLPTGAATSANQATQITAQQTIATNTTRQPAAYTATQVALTTTPTALASAAAVTVEIKNNAVGAVDIYVTKAGGAVETVPAGGVTRFDGITNANQLSVASSTGTPTVFYRIYTQLMQ